MADRFEEAAQLVKTFTKRPADDELLTLYGLYKQATVGDVNTSRPGIFSPTDRAKWDSWKNNEGTSQNDAKVAYVKLVDEISPKYK